MAQQDIILVPPGESALDAFTKIQANFTDLYDTVIPAVGGAGNSYLRMSGGLTKASGNTDVICFANLEEEGGTPGNFIFEPDAVNGDSVSIIRPGLYTVCGMVGITEGTWKAMEIRADQDGVIDNASNDTNTRSRQGIFGAGILVPGTTTQTFKCLAGCRIWFWTNGTPDAYRYLNQFSIVGPFFSKVFP